MKLQIILFSLLITIPNIARAQTDITEHLKTVEAHLRAKDVSHWSAAKQEARADTLNTLRAYYKRGVYPENIDFADARVPYFVDHKGTNCAVAELMVADGFEVEVEKIAATENNRWLHEMTSSDLARWTEAAGISVQEAGWIQPTYEFCVVTFFLAPPDVANCGDTIQLSVKKLECDATVYEWSLFRNEERSSAEFLKDSTTQTYIIPDITMNGERFTFEVLTTYDIGGEAKTEHTVKVACEGQEEAPPKKEVPIIIDKDMGNDIGAGDQDLGNDDKDLTENKDVNAKEENPAQKKDAEGCSSAGSGNRSWLVFGILFLLGTRRKRSLK